jgi:glycosyltransferase involved in cell wall biosynthesis
MDCEVSVILPCYNGAKWISRAIESILSQKYKAFELIIIDDDSIDSSAEIVSGYLHDQRVRYIHVDHKGFSGALNKGVAESSGEWIGFIGQDDLWTVNKLAVQMSYVAQNRNIDLVHSDYYLINGKEEILRIIKGKSFENWPSEKVIQCLFLNNTLGFETVLVKKKCFDRLGGFDENMAGFSDHDLWLRVAGYYKIGYINIPLVKKREHERQLSRAKIDSMLKDEFKIIQKGISCYPFLKKVAQRKLAQISYEQGIALLNKGKISEGECELRKTIRVMPWKLKAVAICIAPSLYIYVSTQHEKIPQLPGPLGWIERELYE